MIECTLDLVILNNLNMVLLIFLWVKFAFGHATESLSQKLLLMQVVYIGTERQNFRQSVTIIFSYGIPL